MLHKQTLAVIIPCLNEEGQIKAVLHSIPVFVDAVYVVDDGSSDQTSAFVRQAAAGDNRIQLIRHEASLGVGAAISAGYKAALQEKYDLLAVMAGDGQMDPAELKDMVDPVASGQCDYAKGNRFLFPNAFSSIPPVRLAGNLILTFFTRLITGYWHIGDSQCGYTAIHRRALLSLDLDQLYPRYGYPNDLLIKLGLAGKTVQDICVRPIYARRIRSKLKPLKVIFPISGILLRGAWQGLTERLSLKRNQAPVETGYPEIPN